MYVSVTVKDGQVLAVDVMNPENYIPAWMLPELPEGRHLLKIEMQTEFLSASQPKVKSLSLPPCV